MPKYFFKCDPAAWMRSSLAPGQLGRISSILFTSGLIHNRSVAGEHEHSSLKNWGPSDGRPKHGQFFENCSNDFD
jgi:hypothetical protein